MILKQVRINHEISCIHYNGGTIPVGLKSRESAHARLEEFKMAGAASWRTRVPG